jgi:hypothetical protein
LILAVVASVAGADTEKDGKPVTTFAEQDAAALARGTCVGAVLEKGELALPKDTSRGTVQGPAVAAIHPFDRVCVSVNAKTPHDATVEVSARVELDDGTETDWLGLGCVGNPGEGLPRSSPSLAKEAPVGVAIDTLEVKGGKRGRAVTVLLALKSSSAGETPRVRRVAIAAWPHGERDPAEPAGAAHPAWGKVLEVGERSQCVEDPKISGRICSATSLSMVLAFHGFDRKTAEVCDEVLDRRAQIYGNWALNVAYAGRLGLDASIVRMGSFRPLEDEIAAGRPVVISHRWEKGELTGAPVESSDGHLIVVRGFTKEGDVVVNDPAANPRKGASIRRTYKRAEIEKTWLERVDGIAYVISRPKK